MALRTAAIGLVAIYGCANGAAPPPEEPQPAPIAQIIPDTLNPPPTRLQMQNVDFFVDREIPLRIRRLSGTIRSKTGGPVLFDDKRSFVIAVGAAEVGLTGKDLSLLLNKFVFNYAGSPLRNISISTSGNQIVQKGTLHKVFAMPFEIHANLTAMPDGRIRIRPTRTEILGLHVDRLMQGLGLALEEVINLKQAKGASVSGNDIFLDPTKILPPPSIEGRVTGVRVEGNQVVQTFGNPATLQFALIPDPTARNYMYYRGGTLRFGKLTMADAEMQISDLDPSDAFQFDIDRYQTQLIAGYSKTLISGGLSVWMPDISPTAPGTKN